VFNVWIIEGKTNWKFSIYIMKRVRWTSVIPLILVVYLSGLVSGCGAAMASADSFMIQDKSELSRNKKFKDTKAYKKSKGRRKYYSKRKHHR